MDKRYTKWVVVTHHPEIGTDRLVFDTKREAAEYAKSATLMGDKVVQIKEIGNDGASLQ